MTSASLALVTTKLGKLLPLLASDKPGEVVATAAAITRTLKQAGADWHDLTAVLTRAAPLRTEASPMTGEAICWRDIPHSEQAGWLARMSHSRHLSPWEQNFSASILAQLRFRSWQRLSPKQVGTLDRCISKVAGAQR